ncbi:hypothetical protein RFM26_08625 [Mesorhizobium sp. VK23B]|uniref:DUF4298 domain-containing protein n=1 Tax=Mesorhizobium dulcispinae TaxID=3072316 RepID=A0ABU4X9G2_9HYPH|nr:MULTISPECIES: hypothetical protein [unclassified Mesorhizobium]MDX8465746.1 hypothetical protein [Mesorhizobium sp. VK23B]MDX8471452.1 hypothetical protein [Mesorhizobium sp. VK23A]
MTEASSEPQIDLRDRPLVLAECERYVQRAEKLSREAVNEDLEEGERVEARAQADAWLSAAYDLAYGYYKENKEWLSEDFAFPPELELDLSGELGNLETQDVIRQWANYHMREFYPWLVDRKLRGEDDEAPGL